MRKLPYATVCVVLCLMLCVVSSVATADESILENIQFSYDNALQVHVTKRVPLVVVLCAKWCGPCRAYKSGAITQLARRILTGERKYSLAIVDIDEQPELAEKLLNGTSQELPMTVIYVQKGDHMLKRFFSGQTNDTFVLQHITE